MPTFSTIVPALLAVVLLAFHARATHGTRFAGEFFALAFVYFVVKENLSVHEFFHRYFYAARPPLRIVDAPLGVVVGWLFTSYVAWTVAERLLARFPNQRGGVAHLVWVAMAVTSTISYPMEALGTTMGWWRWTVDGKPWVIPDPHDSSQPWVAIPAVPLAGWAFFVGGFLFWFLSAQRWFPRRRALRWLVFLGGMALHFEAIHGVGEGPDDLFAALFLVFVLAVTVGKDQPGRVAAPPAAAPWWVRHGVELAVTLMAVVVSVFVVTRVGQPRHLLTLLPVGLFVLASLPSMPRATLAAGWGLLSIAGLAARSPKVFMLGSFAMLFFLALGARWLGRVGRRWVGARLHVARATPAITSPQAGATRS